MATLNINTSSFTEILEKIVKYAKYGLILIVVDVAFNVGTFICDLINVVR